MINLNLGNTDDSFVVTLTENATLETGYYLFKFTHITTRDVINVIYNFIDDESAYPERFNQFTIDTSVVFLDQLEGLWKYLVYEQSSSSNTDSDLATTFLERGLMDLQPQTDFSFETYQEDTTYKAYNG